MLQEQVQAGIKRGNMPIYLFINVTLRIWCLLFFFASFSTKEQFIKKKNENAVLYNWTVSHDLNDLSFPANSKVASFSLLAAGWALPLKLNPFEGSGDKI